MKLGRTVSILLAVIMIVSILSGCAGGATTTPTGAASTTAAQTQQTTVKASTAATIPEPAEPGLFGVKQIVSKPITIKIYCSKGADVPSFGDLKHMANYSKATNMAVEWEQPPADLSTERFNIVLASQNLPDMFWNIQAAQFLQLKTSKAIVPIQDYLKECVNVQKVTKANPGSEKYYIDPDGKAYSLPFFDGLTVNDVMILRNDWLKKLNMSVPVTKDDWYKYWIAVRDNDPNGNGKKDEIPLAGETFSRGILSLVSAFGMDNGFFVDAKNGNAVKYSFYDARYKDFLTWINKLWSEKIIDPNILSTDSKTLTNNSALNLVGSYRGKLNGQFNTYMTTIASKVPGYELAGAPPIKSDDGTQFHPGSVPLVRTDVIGGAVTVSNKYPKECVLFCDWFYDFSDPYGGGFVNIFGYEGTTFVYTADKKDYNYSDWVLKNPDKLSPQQALQKYTTRGQHPGYVYEIGSFKMWDPTTVKAFDANKPFYQDSLKYKMPTLTFSSDQNSKIKTTMADIDTYVMEMSAKFMTGGEPLSNFDSYIKKIKDMGIEDILTIYNTVYADWNKPRS